MLESSVRQEIKERLMTLIREVTPTGIEKFDFYWKLVSPRLEMLLNQGLPERRHAGGRRLGIAQLFGTKEGDQVGDLVLAAIGSLAEARKAGVTDREGVSRIVAGYAKAMKGITPFANGIEDFVLNVSNQATADFVKPAKLGRSLMIDSKSMYEVTKNGHKIERHFTSNDLTKFLDELDSCYIVVSGISHETLYNGSVIPLSDVVFRFLKLVATYQGSLIPWYKIDIDSHQSGGFYYKWKIKNYVTRYLEGVGSPVLAQNLKNGLRTVRGEGLFVTQDLLSCYFERVEPSSLRLK